MKIGLVGLGKMGAQIAVRLMKDGHEIVAMDVDPKAVESIVEAGAMAAESREAMTGQLESVIIWLMIPAGVVDSEIVAWLPKLPTGSIIIDGGNSDYRLTRERAKKMCRQRRTLG